MGEKACLLPCRDRRVESLLPALGFFCTFGVLVSFRLGVEADESFGFGFGFSFGFSFGFGFSFILSFGFSFIFSFGFSFISNNSVLPPCSLNLPDVAGFLVHVLPAGR